MTTPQTTPPIRILLIEDDPGDVLLTREALAALAQPRSIDVAANGEEALDFLRRKGDFRNSQRPDLVLLDLNLPRLGGLEVLERIKRDSSLRSIPVVVLTTSASEDDVTNSYRLHANAYVCKPVEVDDYMKVVRAIDQFFLKIARIPEL